MVEIEGLNFPSVGFSAYKAAKAAYFFADRHFSHLDTLAIPLLFNSTL